MTMNSASESFCIFIGMSWNRGAISQQFQTIAHELVNRGHQVVILMDHQKTNYESTASNPALYTWPSYRPTHFQDALFLQKLLWKYRPECIISQFGSENLFLLLGSLNGIPCRITWHHSILERPKDATFYDRLKSFYLFWRKKIILGLASKVVSVSDAASADVHQVFGVPRKKIVTIHNNIKDPLIDISIEKEPDRNRITCTSALIEAKGQETLLLAIPLIRENFPSVFVDFIGSGKSSDRYRELSFHLKIDGNCQFSGLLPYEEVLKKMKNSWITVFPTRSEAFGLVALESLAVGTPVVASDVGGLPEIIQDGVEGFLFPVGDHIILAEKICLLLSNAALRTKMGHNARKKYLLNFNLKEKSKLNAIRIENIIKSFLN